MKTEILSQFENIPYFTLEGFKQAAGMEAAQNVRVLLHRWAKAGNIIPIKKGVYMARRFYEQHRSDPWFSAAVSAMLLPQSYISLEFVLQQHNLLTEVTHSITCITLHNTRRISNPIGDFWYHNIRPDLYLGFSIHEYFGISIARASAAKALFDYLYLRPLPVSKRSATVHLAGEWRINLDELSSTDRDEFSIFVEQSHSPKMLAILNNFRSHAWQP